MYCLHFRLVGLLARDPSRLFESARDIRLLITYFRPAREHVSKVPPVHTVFAQDADRPEAAKTQPVRLTRYSDLGRSRFAPSLPTYLRACFFPPMELLRDPARPKLSFGCFGNWSAGCGK